MKRWIALLLAALSLFSFAACGPEENDKTSEPASSSGGADNAATEEEKAVVPYGVYYLVNDKGQKISRKEAKMSLQFDHPEEKRSRFTVYFRTGIDGKKHYMFYEGDDTNRAIGGKATKVGGEVAFINEKKALASNCFDLIPSADGSRYKIVNAANPELCISYKDGQILYADSAEEGENCYWKIEEAAPSEDYISINSTNGHIVLRIPEYFTTSRSVGFTRKIAQMWVDYFDEAYTYEIELTGYVPYDVIVIKAWADEQIVAGVVNDYNVITADKGFMESELSYVAKRWTKQKVVEVNFGMLHEMGHMFDSYRGWNFESEAWTDLKLCYVLKRLGEAHPDTVFAATPYGITNYVTYDTMVDCLGMHDNEAEGGMTRVYAYFGCAKIFLLIANEIGWEPYVQTFHWFQDNGKLESDYERVDRYYTFVEKLGEFSGKDIHKMIDDINPKAWDVMVDYFSGKTNKAI